MLATSQNRRIEVPEALRRWDSKIILINLSSVAGASEPERATRSRQFVVFFRVFLNPIRFTGGPDFNGCRHVCVCVPCDPPPLICYFVELLGTRKY